MSRRIIGRGGCAMAVLAVPLSLLLVACGQSDAPDCGALTVEQPWVREAPQGAEVMGAYFELVNDGDSRVVVNGVSSSQFDRAEMHETVVEENGQASMKPVERVGVPAGEAVAFEPGGRHVMLFAPSQPYAAGDQVEIVLACGADSAELPIAATVRAQGPDAPASGMDHSQMNHGMSDDASANAEGVSDEADASEANEDSASAE